MSLDRTELLYGRERTESFRSKKIVLAGLGGVGLYALESLARAGLKNFILIDGDKFEESNLNRQLYALPDTLGRPKVQVARERILALSPDAAVEAKETFLNAGNAAELLAPDADFILDAVDDAEAKAALAVYALEHSIPIVSSMGTARRTDPSKITLTKLGRTEGDPLARKLRKLLRDYPQAKEIMVVLSKEAPCPVESFQPLPSSGMVPAAAGINMAAYVINTFCKNI